MDAILIFWYECLFHVPFCAQAWCKNRVHSIPYIYRKHCLVRMDWCDLVWLQIILIQRCVDGFKAE
jgi:hypothetical protein